MSELTVDELAQLRALGPRRYRQQVISLFASGHATEAHWSALATLIARQPGQVQLYLHPQRFRDRSARQHEWQALADLVLACSESGTGEIVRCIDRSLC